jgi:HAD superfamily hydrolase (TIGR01549 family)
VIRAVVFEVGECLVDETRQYGTWADWLQVPRHTFAAMFGAVIAQGRDHRETFEELRPGFDLSAEREKRTEAGRPETFDESDLYPDVRDSLACLRADGLWLGIAGNQTVRAGKLLRGLFSEDVDLIGTSDDWGASKPDPAFFERVADVVPAEPGEILYVGDRVDNDLRPATAAGMRTALVHRGPWATIQWNTDEARKLPTFRVESLLELSPKIAQVNAPTRQRTDGRLPAVQPVVQVANRNGRAGAVPGRGAPPGPDPCRPHTKYVPAGRGPAPHTRKHLPGARPQLRPPQDRLAGQGSASPPPDRELQAPERGRQRGSKSRGVSPSGVHGGCLLTPRPCRRVGLGRGPAPVALRLIRASGTRSRPHFSQEPGNSLRSRQLERRPARA